MGVEVCSQVRVLVMFSYSKVLVLTGLTDVLSFF